MRARVGILISVLAIAVISLLCRRPGIAQQIVQIMPPYNGIALTLPSTGILKVGSSVGLSLNSGVLAVGTGAVGNTQGSIQAGNYYSGATQSTAIAFGKLVGTDICFNTNSAFSSCFDSNGIRVASAKMYGFSSNTAASGAANDTGIERVSAGVIGINNGTAGTGGGLKIPGLKSTTGTRYLCIDTTGLISSSASACSGT